MFGISRNIRFVPTQSVVDVVGNMKPVHTYVGPTEVPNR